MLLRRHFVARVCGAAFAAFMLSLVFATASARWRADAAEPRGGKAVAKQVTRLVNRTRAKRGLSRLRGNRKLGRAARRYARWMERRDVFSHYGVGTPAVRAARSGYPLRTSDDWWVGETIAFNRAGDARAIVRAWLRSPSHREVVLEPRFREVGVGAARGAPYRGAAGGFTVVADFGVL